jgi:hypothetical protein
MVAPNGSGGARAVMSRTVVGGAISCSVQGTADVLIVTEGCRKPGSFTSPGVSPRALQSDLVACQLNKTNQWRANRY